MRRAGERSVGGRARRAEKRLNKSEEGMRSLVIRACPPPSSSHRICSPAACPMRGQFLFLARPVGPAASVAPTTATATVAAAAVGAVSCLTGIRCARDTRAARSTVFLLSANARSMPFDAVQLSEVRNSHFTISVTYCMRRG